MHVYVCMYVCMYVFMYACMHVANIPLSRLITVSEKNLPKFQCGAIQDIADWA